MNQVSKNTIPWNDYSSYIKKRFGVRVQKISINAGFTCPNRDGSKGTGACIYCTNESFSPFYCDSNISVTEQIKKGIDFFSAKYQTQKYLAYFQSYTNTYGTVDKLEKLYTEALGVEGVIGLVIATRPDCINREILEMIARISQNKYISLEFGAESTIDKTLDFINRGHSYQQTIDAVNLTKEYKLNCGLHLILGLPGENENDFYKHAVEVSKLPIDTLKIHQMQVLKKTKLEKIFCEKPELFHDISIEKYIRIICNFLEVLNPKIVVERFTSESPKEMVLYPNWEGKKNFEISHMVQAEMKKRNTIQGKFYLQA